MPLKLTFVIKKHSTNADTGTLYTTNHLRLTNEKTDNGTSYSGTTPHSAKTSAPISDTVPCPSRQARPERPQT